VAGDLTDLDSVRAFLGVSGTGDDALIEDALIPAYSQAVQSWLNRTIAAASYTAVLDGKGTRRILLKNYPVTAIASLSIDGIVIPAAAGPPYCRGYVFNEHAVSLYGYWFAPGFGNVQISYTAGYTSTPADIAQATIEWIADAYKSRDRIGQRSKSLQGSEVVSYDITPMPKRVEMMLKQYRLVAPL
jgi:hypothetical protein